MSDDRTARNPDDEWLWKHSRTDVEIAVTQARALDAQPDINLQDYTCHDCALRRVCTLAYANYNTNGDCLLDK